MTHERLPLVQLPSGNTISGELWEDMKEAGTWVGWLDARMYPPEDRAFMDREIRRPIDDDQGQTT